MRPSLYFSVPHPALFKSEERGYLCPARAFDILRAVRPETGPSTAGL
jgi:hypothetical protein